MQSQEERDRKTLDIGVALGLFVLVVTSAAILLWVGVSQLGLSEDAAGVLGSVSFAVAGVAVIVYLARVRAR